MQIGKNKIIILTSTIFILIGVLFFKLEKVNVLYAAGAVENLDELINRKSRLASVNWGYSLLQNNTNNYIWQPESLQYTDVTTGSEVMRLTFAPNNVGGENHDIAITHWNANGNRLLVHSNRPTDAFPYANGVNKIWMLINADGSKLRPAKNAAAQLATTDPYTAWSPVMPDILYQGASNDGQGLASDNLYKVIVSDTTISRAPYLTFSGVTGIHMKRLYLPTVLQSQSGTHPWTSFTM